MHLFNRFSSRAANAANVRLSSGWTLAMLLLGLLLAGPLSVSGGEIPVVGRVVSNGRGVPGVTVKTEGQGFNWVSVVTTDSDGNFQGRIRRPDFIWEDPINYITTYSKNGLTFARVDSFSVVDFFRDAILRYTLSPVQVVTGPVTGYIRAGSFGVPNVTVAQSAYGFPSSNGGLIGIPDNNSTGILTTSSVTAAGTITSVRLSLNIAHSYKGDLEVSLVHPDGTRIYVHNRSGGAAANIIQTFTLSDFNGRQPNGSWQLLVRDLASADVGTLAPWTLEVATSVVSDSTGAFNLGTLGSGLLTPSRSGVSFSPASVSSAPGVDNLIFVNLGSIRGRVTDSNSNALSGMQIKFFSPDGTDVATTVTASDGKYDTGLIFNGASNWTVRPNRAGWEFNPATRTSFAGATDMDFVVTQSPPTISDVSNKSVNEDSTIGVPFTIGDGQTATSSLSVTASSGNEALIPSANLVVTGTGASRTVAITPAPEQYGGPVTITLTVQDANGQTASDTFAVTVNPVNDMPVAGSPTALDFDGVDDLALVTNPGLATGNAVHSIEAWVYPRSLPAARSWLLHLGGYGAGHHWLYNPDGTIQFGAWGRDAQVSGAPLLPGRWSHLAAVWDGTNYVVYVNGVKAGQVQSASGFDMRRPARLISFFPFVYEFEGPADLNIGAYPGAGELRFNGLIDEVRVWNVALTDAQIQTRMNVPIRGNETGLLTYLPFDEGHGITAYDYAAAGGRVNATLNGGVRFATRREDTGLVLDGVTGKVVVTNSDSLNVGNLTLSAWINTTNDAGGIINKYQDASANGYNLFVAGGHLNAWFFAPGGSVWGSGNGLDGGVVNDGFWHHVVFTVGPDGGRLYVDGFEKAFRAWSGTPSVVPTTPIPVQIGVFPSTFPSDHYLSGRIDEVSIWSRALSKEEVQASMGRSPAGTEPGLLLHYSFSETSGDTVLDIAGGDHNGTFEGGVARGPAEATNPFGRWVVNEETASPIYLQGFDVEAVLAQPGGLPISYTIVSVPSHGVLSRGVTTLNAGSTADWTNINLNPITYTPNPAYNGLDSFTYKLTDQGGGISQIVTVPILVQEMNDNPTVTVIANTAIEADTSTGPIPFTVDDEETAPGNLILSALSSNTRLLPQANIVFGGSGSNRTVTITPAAGEIGTVTVILTVTDTAVPAGSASREFKVRVEPQPAYALIDLGVLGTLNQGSGFGINDLAWAVGTLQPAVNEEQPILNRGLSGTGVSEKIDAGNRLGIAYAISGDNEITGYVKTGSPAAREAFIWSSGVLTTLGSKLGGSDSEGRAINSVGDIVGSYTASGARKAFFLSSGDPSSVTLPALTGFTFGAEALDLNDAGLVVGRARTAAGRGSAFVWSGIAGITNLPVLPAHDLPESDSGARAVNVSGQIAGYSAPNSLPNAARRAVVWSGSTVSDLGVLTNGSSSEAWDINGFGQVVGGADRQTGRRAFLYTAGQMRDLNDLIHDSRDRAGSDFVFANSTWELREARAINTSGAIVGTGVRNGSQRGFLAVPAWVIGRQIARPEGAVERIPEIEIISGASGDTSANSFFWSDFEKRLYAIRPVAARLKWFTSFSNTSGSGTNLTVNSERIVVEGMNVWPKRPMIHVAQTPVEIVPRGVSGFPYGFQQVIYDTTGNTAVVDPTSKTFDTSVPGYHVIYYLKTDGFSPSPTTQPPYFEVVRTVPWNAPGYLKERNALVGDVLEDPQADGDPGHQDYFDKQGYVFFENAFYDGAGPDRAYDRPSRLGPIIPVNLDTTAQNDDLVVVWYRLSPIGVAWSSAPVRYSISWPSDDVVNRIVIASGLGSGPLPSNQSNRRPYNQPVRGLPGFNPNEEHALIANANGGSSEAIFALRYDLNRTDTSRAYALLKYQDGAGGPWRISVYKVVGEQAPWFFRYSGTAGREIAPPYPLSLLPLQANSAGTLGPWWEDWKGTIYARAAGPNGLHADIRVRWFYPLQPGFYYDLDGDNIQDAQPGASLAWMDRRTTNTLSSPNVSGGTAGTPIEVTYDVAWPDAPVLQVGETATIPSGNGIANIFAMAAAQFVYDDLTPNWNPLISTQVPPISTLARLYDPISTREYRLSQSETIPDTIKKTNRGGKEYFDDLPPTLGERLVYDPVNRWLLFTGKLDTTGAGQPLLLPNVLSSRERDAIKKLATGNTVWAGIIDKLYALTRNPNGVDLSPADGAADQALRVGLIRQGTNIVPEPLGAGPKALTAALGDMPPALPRPVNALQLDGLDDRVNAGVVDLDGQSFTVEFWAKHATAPGVSHMVLGHGTQSANRGLFVGFRDNRFVFDLWGDELLSAGSFTDGQWHHWAASFDAATRRQNVYMDGQLVASRLSDALYFGSGALVIGSGPENFQPYLGQLDEVRLWSVARSQNSILRDRKKALTGYEGGLLRYYRCDEITGGRVADGSPAQAHGSLQGGLSLVASTAPAGIPPRYLTIAENNSPDLAGLPIRLHIIQVDDGPFQGDLKIVYPGNVFDQRLTMRHSSDFGGDPDPLQFEWYYKPDDAGFDPTDLPLVGANGAISEIKGWIPYSNVTPASGFGVNDVTIGEGGESGLLTLGDTWFICRHRGFAVRGETNWSGWIGDPSGGGTPRAQLAEGWIKRVIRGLNPFDARTADFHANATATYASMVLQAGRRYEGDIAFNPSGDNLNSLGLIEAYTTVLNRGRELSIEGLPPVNFSPANNALLLAASRVSDLYALLGNEAYADAQDPTIGFTTSSDPYRALASSIFSFQNQMDSLLEEELALLRGRDTSHAGVAAQPVYNRLFWNFTLGDGEVAYQQNYRVTDQNRDGFINETDARTLYPQGHGDAWGHYLTAAKTYYELLRHPMFTWVPRTERVVVAGVPVEVDYLDERKFAQVAAAKARAGKEIVDLTYRSSYVDDPDGQWQGYRDTDTSRAWGVADWASRAGQAAYFDWLTVNTLLPSTDPNTNHTGIQIIDRQRVSEIDDILSQYNEIQATMDKADVGLNPLGLAKGAMQFDLDPTFLAVGSTAAIGRQAVQGLAHFEQLNERAIKALKNAQRIWDEANAQNRNLRENQDTIDEFTNNAIDEEINYRNQLIEIFGYPYAGDIGPGRTYPSGYNGPDLYHYMYVPVTEITGITAPPSTNFRAFFTNVAVGVLGNTYFPSEEKKYFTTYDIAATDPAYLQIEYPQANGPWAFSAPATWGQRRAPGKVQDAISDVLQATARLKFAGQNYDGLMLDIEDKLQLLKRQYAVNASNITIMYKNKNTIVEMNKAIGSMNGVRTVIRRLSVLQKDMAEAVSEGLPKVLGLANDVTSPARGALGAGLSILNFAAEVVADGLEVAGNAVELAKEEVALNTEIELTANNMRYEELQQLKELEAMVRNEINVRLEVFEQQEALRQAYGRYLSTVAEGQRVLDELVRFRKLAAGQTTEYRYRDMAFRIFRNETLQKYRTTFDLAARYVYLCATTYDFESNYLGSDRRAASRFFDQIVRQRQLGVLIDGEPIPGQSGLADIQGRMIQNWEIIEPQFGMNNPLLENGRFSLRSELFREKDEDPDDTDDASDQNWKATLRSQVVADVWAIPEFRRYCRPFAPESSGPQPALVIRFPTTIQFGQNYFGKPLSGGDSAFDPSLYSTKVNAAGIGLNGYDEAGLSRTPRVYLIPVGMDVMRAPTGNDLTTRQWRVLDQAVPVPFAIGANDFTNPNWIAAQDSLSENYGQPRRFSAMRAYSDSYGAEDGEITTSSRLVARSVWNTEWMLIIPGGTLLNDPNEGLRRFIESVSDIELKLMVYSFSGQ